MTILVTALGVVPVFAADNPYLSCPDCNDTSNTRQTHTTASSSHSTSTSTLPSPPMPVTPTTVPSTHEMPSKIPNWVKAVFGYYAQGNLSDDDLIKALQFLIQQGIIKV